MFAKGIIGPILVVAISAFAVTPTVAQQEDPGFAQLSYLVDADPDAALDRITALLDELQAAPNANKRLIFDLYRQGADLLIEGGQIAQAAQIVAQLAGFAAQFRSELDIDPTPLFAEAATLLESEGNLRGARDALIALLEEQRGGAGPADETYQTINDIVRLSDALNVPLPPGLEPEPQAMVVAPEGDDTRSAQASTRSTGEGGYREVDVFYATDRAQTGKTRPSEFYGSGRGALELGVATVTIPETHTPGMVEAPSIWKLEFRADPAKHVVLQSVEPMDPDSFYGRMQSEFDTRPTKEAFVFIHGFNVKFDQAARRAAQIAYDMDYSGVPVLYSWPSFGSTLKYVADTAVVRLSGRRLSLFLEDLVTKSGAETVHVVAHSMGNRALTDALELMALRMGVQEGDTPVLGQVLFAAPDVDAGLFKEMVPTIRPLAKRLTLYASDEDWALVASRKLHGNALRAGIGGDHTLTSPVVDSVDMSVLGEDMLAHSYFADDSSALADMITLFWRNSDPQDRCGLVEDRDAGDVPVWRYQQGVCAERGLINVLAHLRNGNIQTGAEAIEVVRRTVKDADTAQKLGTVVSGIVGE